MKKLISIIITTMLVLGVLCTCTAFAAGPVEVTRGDNDTTVTVVASTLEAEEETTILVVDKGTSIADAFATTTKIKHIDQTTATSEGVATFKFMYAEKPALDVYVGYATMAADAQPFDAVVDEVKDEDPVDPPVNPDDPEEPKFTYGDVNDDTSINVSDATAVVQYVLKRTPFTKNDGSAYENGILAADVTKDSTVNVSDATAIVQYVLKRTPFPEAE